MSVTQAVLVIDLAFLRSYCSQEGHLAETLLSHSSPAWSQLEGQES